MEEVHQREGDGVRCPRREREGRSWLAALPDESKVGDVGKRAPTDNGLGEKGRLGEARHRARGPSFRREGNLEAVRKHRGSDSN